MRLAKSRGFKEKGDAEGVRNMRELTLCLTLLMTLFVPALSQRIEDGWKGLLPLKSARNDVEKVFGKGLLHTAWSDRDLYDYSDEDVVITVLYAGVPCDGETDSFYRLDVPADTVLHYWVQLKQERPLSQFTFDTTRFDTEPRHPKFFNFYQSRHPLNIVPNEAGVGYGIEIWGDAIDGNNFVRGLNYGLPWGEREKRQCGQEIIQKRSAGAE